jgi:hypothetical protein
LQIRASNTDNNIVIALVEYLTLEEVGQPLGKGLAWPGGWIVDDAVGWEKSSGDDTRVDKSNKSKEKKLL